MSTSKAALLEISNGVAARLFLGAGAVSQRHARSTEEDSSQFWSPISSPARGEAASLLPIPIGCCIEDSRPNVKPRIYAFNTSGRTGPATSRSVPPCRSRARPSPPLPPQWRGLTRNRCSSCRRRCAHTEPGSSPLRGRIVLPAPSPRHSRAERGPKGI